MYFSLLFIISQLQLLFATHNYVRLSDETIQWANQLKGLDLKDTLSNIEELMNRCINNDNLGKNPLDLATKSLWHNDKFPFSYQQNRSLVFYEHELLATAGLYIIKYCIKKNLIIQPSQKCILRQFKNINFTILLSSLNDGLIYDNNFVN